MTLTKLVRYPDFFVVTRYFLNGSFASSGTFTDINDAQEWSDAWLELVAESNPSSVPYTSQGLVLPAH